MSGEELSKVSSPVCSKKPWCSKGHRFANTFGFPEFQGPVDGVDGIGSLGFSKVVGESTDKIASLLANFIGT